MIIDRQLDITVRTGFEWYKHLNWPTIFTLVGWLSFQDYNTY